jgi:hypothetical protein
MFMAYLKGGLIVRKEHLQLKQNVYIGGFQNFLLYKKYVNNL